MDLGRPDERHGEHTMASLWAKKEISCLCDWSEVHAAAQQARRRRLQHDTLVDRENQTEQSICDHCGQEGCEQQRSGHLSGPGATPHLSLESIKRSHSGSASSFRRRSFVRVAVRA